MKNKFLAGMLAVTVSLGVASFANAGGHCGCPYAEDKSNKCIEQQKDKMMHKKDMMIKDKMSKYEKLKKMSIVEAALSKEKFSTLVLALQKGGLVNTLQGDGPFTVFAPTNEAFSQMDQEVLANLLKPENKDELANVLKYHVVSGKVKSNELSKFNIMDKLSGDKEVKSLAGSEISIEKDKGMLVLNKSANVVKSDIHLKNGVIHVIDRVILPPEE